MVADWPGVRVNIFSLQPAQNTYPALSILLTGRVIEQSVIISAGIENCLRQFSQEVSVPGEVVVCPVTVRESHGVITVSEKTLQVCRDNRVVPVPQASRVYPSSCWLAEVPGPD